MKLYHIRIKSKIKKKSVDEIKRKKTRHFQM
jgi:hypothetical protein